MGSKGRWEWHWRFGGGTSNTIPNYEWYNPFTASSDVTLPAPYTEYPGAVLFKSALLRIRAGITDYIYIYTLENLVKKKGGAMADTARRAEEFLSEIKKSIPMFPGLKGVEGADAGALLGKGMKTKANDMTPVWREKIAEFIKELSGR